MPTDRLLNNRYRILSRLGAGGFGETLLAADTHLPSQRRCVIKQLKPQDSRPDLYPLLNQRFQREAVILETLGAGCTAIPQLYAYFAEDQQFYLVQEWIDGPTLSQQVRSQGCLGEPAVKRFLTDVLTTLDYVHQHQVIHRDIKPDNILVRQREQQGAQQAVLIDFGIAKEVVCFVTESPATPATSLIIGTPGFMPPEQLNGHPTYSTDLYSLGLTALYLLTGRFPQDLPRDRSGQLQWQTCVPDLSPAFAQVLNQAIDPDLRYRYPTAPAMLAALQPLLRQDEPADERVGEPVDELAGEPAGDRANDRAPSPWAFPATLPQVSVPTIDPKIDLDPVFGERLQSAASVAPISQTDRHRMVLLNKVRNYWIKGVLQRSLPEQGQLCLGWNEQFSALDYPWSAPTNYQQHPSASPTKSSPSSGNIIEQFDQLGAGRTLLILGEPGSGKTMTLLELAQVLVERAEVNLQQPIPVVFNLSSWGTVSRRTQRSEQSLTDWLIQELKKHYQVSPDIGQYWLQEQALILLLDGLDEVHRDRRNACVEVINQFAQDHGQTEMVVCCRRSDYDGLTQNLSFQSAIALQPLNLSQIQSYLQQTSPALATTIATDSALQDLMRSPLMLHLFVLAYEQAPLTLNADPDPMAQRQHLFQAYVDRMLGYALPQQRYSQTQMRHWLRWLAQQLLQQSQTIFLIEQLQPSWLTVNRQRRAYAMGVGLLGGSLIGLISGTNVELIFRNGVGLVSGLMGVLGGILVGILLEAIVPQIEPVETLRWSWSKAKASAKSGLQISLIVGMIMAIGSGAIAWYTTGPSDILRQAFLYGRSGLGTGLIFILLRGLSGAIVVTKVRPNQGILQSAKNTLGFMAIGILCLGTLGLLLGLPPLFGVLIGILFGCFSPAGIACLQHFVLRSVLTICGHAPWNYTQFLDELTERILLQKVGGGYLFIHRLLLEHLAKN